MRCVTVKAIWESADPFSLWYQPVFFAVSLFTNQGLYKLSKEGICNQLGAHRWSAATSQLMGSNTHSRSDAVIWNTARQGPVQNAIPRTAGRCPLKHWCQQETAILYKRPKSLVLAPTLGMDGSGRQCCPQPQHPSGTPGEATCWNMQTLSLQLLTEQKLKAPSTSAISKF